MTETIFALSSGRPPAAIAIIRVTGPKALETLEKLAGLRPEPRVAKLVTLRSGAEILDRALALRFDAPNTVTGDDLVELHLHGGRAVVEAVSAALAAIDGVRPAEAGEFTRRAFANGKIDLTEAEGVADLLAAETQGQRRAAIALAGGALGRKVSEWTERLLALAAAVEAQLDFSDEGDVDAGLPTAWHDSRRALAEEIAQLLARPPAERLRDGIRVVIAGPPNSGKSTLLNAIVQREAAITSDIAGTTRDLIEVPVAIAGLPFLLIDSAGLRDSDDLVEAIGVERAEAAIAGADLVIWLGDARHRPERADLLLVHTKADLSPGEEASLNVSALTGLGMPELLAALVEKARELLPRPDEFTVNARQRQALGGALQHIDAAGRHDDVLLVAEELRQGRLCFDAITGRAGVEHMLDALFGRFCIGK